MPELPRTIQCQCRILCASFNMSNHTWRNARGALDDFKEEVEYAPFVQYKRLIKDEIQLILSAQLPNCNNQQIQIYAQRAINAIDRRFQSFY